MQQYFGQLNQYYDKIYVLSVEPAADRRQLFAERFQGLRYSFFFGADKNKFDVQDLESKQIFSEKLTREHHRFSKTMMSSEIACSWSHKLIYEDMLANNYQRILILEDDAVPNPETIALVPEILKQIPDDCELLRWSWAKFGNANTGTWFKQLVYHVQHSIGKLKWNHTMIRHLYARNYSKYLKKAGFHDSTYAYAITRSGAEKLVNMQTPIQYIADNLLAHASTKGVVNGYIVLPQVFLHDNLSDGTYSSSYIRKVVRKS